MNQDEKNKIKKYLKRGDIKLIAESAEVNSSAVIHFFNGKNNNSQIEVYVNELYKIRKEQREEAFKMMRVKTQRKTSKSINKS